MHNVVLFSGGLDSTTLLHHVVERCGKDNVSALHIDYGSIQRGPEFEAALRIVKLLGCGLFRFKLDPNIFADAGSTLMGEGEVPNGEYRKNGPQSTVVPFRNGVFISVATAVASRFGDAEVWIAAHADDGQLWAYPDCRPEFMESMAEAVHEASLGKIQLVAPYQYMTKAAIVEMAARDGAPILMSYSCYRGELVHCGTCATCLDRHQAFRHAGFYDPTVYREPIISPRVTLKAWGI